MKINKIVVGLLETNCYVLSIDNECIVIDPGDDYNKIKQVIGNKKVIAVIVTHYHFDHVGALDNFDKKLILDRNNLQEKQYNIGKFNFEIIYTKGHKEDSITVYFKNEKIMFTGDFIFKGSIGRMDLPGGSKIEMFNSLHKMKKYPRDILIYPGHGDLTNLGSELDDNCIL